ncbi:TKL protein kinase [Phytophthora cinnamomi]|nr:TKL protein kinase [Phytophthora cinnamomi]
MWPSTNCTESTDGCEEAEDEYQLSSCISDQYAYTAEAYGDVPYLLVDMYDDDDCETYKGSFALRANGDCIARGDHAVKVVMNMNGSATVTEYSDDSCSDQDIVEGDIVDATWFESYTCTDAGFVFYNNAYPGTSGSGSLTTAESGALHHFKSHLPTYLAQLRM